MQLLAVGETAGKRTVRPARTPPGQATEPLTAQEAQVAPAALAPAGWLVARRVPGHHWPVACAPGGYERGPRQMTITGTQPPMKQDAKERHTMWPANYSVSIRTLRADALFVSALQRSDEPSVDQVQQAITAAVRAFGRAGCADRQPCRRSACAPPPKPSPLWRPPKAPQRSAAGRTGRE